MAIASGDLTALNSVIELKLPTDRTAVAGVQYPTGGAGTIVLEGTLDGITWVDIFMSHPDGSAAASGLAAAGVGYADVSYFKKIRVRKSVGAAAISPVLSLNSP